MVYNTVTGEGTAPVPLRWEFSLAWEQTSGPKSSISWWESLKGSQVPRLANWKKLLQFSLKIYLVV